MDGSAADTIHGIVQARIEEILAEADGDDRALVQLCGNEIRYALEYQNRVWRLLDQAVARERARGVPMTRIAVWCGLSDSYLARRLFRRGVPRKTVRGPRPK